MAYSKEKPASEKSKPLAVYTIIEKEGAEKDDKGFWVRIGSAFRNRDDSINVYFNALPINGKIHIREQSDRKED